MQVKHNEKGYVTEDDIFNLIVENNLPLVQIDGMCELVLSKGIIIHEGLDSEVDDEDVYDRSRTDYDEVFDQVIGIEPNLKYLINEIKVIKPPQHREFDNLILQAKNGNDFARDRIILMYLRTAVRLALNHSLKYRTNLSETIQEAFIGLVAAVDRYEIGKHNSFISYSSLWIMQNMQRELLIFDSLIYYPGYLKDQVFKIINYLEDNGIDFTNSGILERYKDLISKELEMDVLEVEKFLNLLYPVLSLNSFTELGYSEIDFNAEHSLFEHIFKMELSSAMDKALDNLPERLLQVMLLRYGFIKDRIYTLEQVGKRMGVTRERIRQLEVNAIKRLRNPKYSKMLKQFI